MHRIHHLNGTNILQNAVRSSHASSTTYFVGDDMPTDEDYHSIVKKALDKADRSFVPIPAALMSWLRSAVKKYDPSKV
jgi:hypothetical protein